MKDKCGTPLFFALRMKPDSCRYYDSANCWYFKTPCQGLPCDVYVKVKVK
jgi:hypothetical protein